MVALNRAVAAAMAQGPEAGLALLDDLDPQLADHHRLHAVRAHLLEMAGDRAGAAAAFRRGRLALHQPARAAVPHHAGRPPRDRRHRLTLDRSFWGRFRRISRRERPQNVSARAGRRAADLAVPSPATIEGSLAWTDPTSRRSRASCRAAPSAGATRSPCTGGCASTTRCTTSSTVTTGCCPDSTDVAAAAIDTATFSSASGLTFTYDERRISGLDRDATPLVMMDPPEHTDFRRLLARGFTPRQRRRSRTGDPGLRGRAARTPACRRRRATSSPTSSSRCRASSWRTTSASPRPTATGSTAGPTPSWRRTRPATRSPRPTRWASWSATSPR